MEKKPKNTEAKSEPAVQTLAELLAYTRQIKGLKLRDVEEATNKDVSNGYLSQLETGKITRPRPNILHSLSQVYGLSYELLMEKAGYLAPPSAPELRTASPNRHGRVPTFSKENLTQEEEEKLLEYLAFLRSRRSKVEKT